MPAVAVPLLVANCTVIVWLLAEVSVAVRVAVPPSVTVASPRLITTAPSSFRIVPVACPSAIVAFTAFDRFTRNVSSGSTVLSPLTATVIVPVVAPAGIVALPLTAP